LKTVALALAALVPSVLAMTVLGGCRKTSTVSEAERNAPPPAGGTQAARPDAGGGTSPGPKAVKAGSGY